MDGVALVRPQLRHCVRLGCCPVVLMLLEAGSQLWLRRGQLASIKCSTLPWPLCKRQHAVFLQLIQEGQAAAVSGRGWKTTAASASLTIAAILADVGLRELTSSSCSWLQSVSEIVLPSNLLLCSFVCGSFNIGRHCWQSSSVSATAAEGSGFTHFWP